VALGFRINTVIDRPRAELVREFDAMPSTDLSDVMYGSGTMTRRIFPVWTPVKRAVGPAVTISLPTASFNVLKVGLNQTKAGDVVVVNAYGNTLSPMVGANVIRGLLHRGIAAFIIDGAIRDPVDIRRDGLPVYACAIATADGPNGPHVGEVNYPVACGGVVVNPGDIVVADEDGIAVVPPEAARDVLERARALQERFASIQPILLKGEITKVVEIEASLKEAGCEFVTADVRAVSSAPKAK
jgi:regulator of RNase E activity RraA